MSDNIKNWLYILGTILVTGMVVTLAFKILWFLLPIIIVLYVILVAISSICLFATLGLYFSS